MGTAVPRSSVTDATSSGEREMNHSGRGVFATRHSASGSVMFASGPKYISGFSMQSSMLSWT